jgi:dTDP-4-dehydrorhamnose reductase
MIAILGSTGYVGGKYLNYLQASGIDCMGLSRSEVDYSDVSALSGWLSSESPNFLINAAGYTGKPNVDACERHKAECLFGNAVLPGRIRKACEETGTPWGHVSSGCVYQGRREDGVGWSEDDAPNFSFRNPPCSFYSGTKALGEELLGDAEQCYVWRLRVPFNHEESTRNYLCKLLAYDRLLDAENSLSHLDDFVKATVSCHLKEIPFGVYNVINPGAVTTRQVTQWMREEGITAKEFSFFENEESFMKEAAKTPRSSCVLDASKLTASGLGLRSVEEAVRDSLRKMKETRQPETVSA